MPAPTQSQSTTQSARKRRRMTIEDALRWAIRDELPKRRQDAPIRGPAPPAMHAMWRAGVFGGPIDNWSREPGMPPAMGDPHPDAITIEAHLLVLSDALVLAAAGSRACPLDLAAYPIQVNLRGKADLGVLESAAMHATPAWLMTCAIRGGRPDVGAGPTFEPVTSDNNKITLWRTVQTQRGTGPDGRPWLVSHDEAATSKGDARDYGLFCKLKWTRGNLEILEEQLRYAYWHAAIAYLVPALQFLASIEVLPPASSPAPWIEPQPAAAEPLPSLRPARQLTLKDRRPAGRRAPASRRSPVRTIDPRDWAPPSGRLDRENGLR